MPISLTVGLKPEKKSYAYIKPYRKSPSLTVGLKQVFKHNKETVYNLVSIPHSGLKTSNLHTKKSKKYQALS